MSTRFSSFLLAGLCAASLPACTTHTVTDAFSQPAQRTTQEIAEDHLIDIGIAIFSPGDIGDEERNSEELIDPEVRKAEATYLAYNLRNTLADTENWGAVRVLPRGSQAIDLMVYGEIVESNGVRLVVDILAIDATGREWVRKRYVDRASQLSYRQEIGGDEDAFQDLYNKVADDILDAYLELPKEAVVEVRTTAMLRFAQDISPYAFDDFLGEDKDGNPVIQRLPSADDPMLGRVAKIREREQMFIDLLDEHYNEFHDQMNQPYSDWRRYTYEELLAYEDLKRNAAAAKLLGAATVVGGVVAAREAETRTQSIASNAAIAGGVQVFRGGMQLSAQAKLHAAAVEELADSFEAEVEPMIVEIEGETVKLEGTAQEQFEEWRALLREIYQSETGLNLEEWESEPALPDVRFDQ